MTNLEYIRTMPEDQMAVVLEESSDFSDTICAQQMARGQCLTDGDDTPDKEVCQMCFVDWLNNERDRNG